MGTKAWLIVLICFFVILVVARFLLAFREFKYQLDYINSEIERSSPREKKYWQKKRRRLWWRFLLFPF